MVPTTADSDRTNCPPTPGTPSRTFASKRAWLWGSLPPVLPVQLKRFRRERDGAFRRLGAGENGSAGESDPEKDLDEALKVYLISLSIYILYKKL